MQEDHELAFFKQGCLTSMDRSKRVRERPFAALSPLVLIGGESWRGSPTITTFWHAARQIGISDIGSSS
jgi:hypothetical protein